MGDGPDVSAKIDGFQTVINMRLPMSINLKLIYIRRLLIRYVFMNLAVICKINILVIGLEQKQIRKLF